MLTVVVPKMQSIPTLHFDHCHMVALTVSPTGCVRALLRCPKKCSGFRFSSSFSTAAPKPPHCIVHRTRSVVLLPTSHAQSVQRWILTQFCLTHKSQTKRIPIGYPFCLEEPNGLDATSESLILSGFSDIILFIKN